MAEYKISLWGCDDYTQFTMELTDQEADLIKRVADKSEATSSYGCMPTLTIEEVKDDA